jgi:two-component system, chemotaxis family, response regulator Rcp1
MMSAERPQILLVEDNPADAELVAEALAEAALECGLSIVRDGLQAIAFIERLDADPSTRCPDLVLLDLNLPKVGGVEVLCRVRLSPRCRDAKVVVISSSDTPVDRERSLRLGASEYFHKPSSLKQFMELGPKVRALLEGPGLAI